MPYFTYTVMFILLSCVTFGQSVKNDSIKRHKIDSITGLVREEMDAQKAIQYCTQCLMIDRKIAKEEFVDFYLSRAYFRGKQYDSAMHYGNTFLSLKYKKEKGEYSHYWRACNLKLETSEILYSIDTTRHDYRHAVKYLLRYNPEKWKHGSATGRMQRMKIYYSNIVTCYVALGEPAKANKYKKKLMQYVPTVPGPK